MTKDQQNPLTKEQNDHLVSLIVYFAEAVTNKYVTGQKEHGGNIWDMSAERLLDEAINENLDQFTYLMTLKQKMKGEL